MRSAVKSVEQGLQVRAEQQGKEAAAEGQEQDAEKDRPEADAALCAEDSLPLAGVGELGLDAADAAGRAAAVEPFAVHPPHQHQQEAEKGADPGKDGQGRGAEGRGEAAARELEHLDEGGGRQQHFGGKEAEGRSPRLAVEEIERPEQQRREAHGDLALLQLHPAVGRQIGGGGGADVVQPVLPGDAVHPGLFAEGLLEELLLGVGCAAELAVHLGVVEAVLRGVGDRGRLLLLGGALRRSSGIFLHPAGCARRRPGRCGAGSPRRGTSTRNRRHGRGGGCTGPASRSRCGDRARRSRGRPRCHPEG